MVYLILNDTEYAAQESVGTQSSKALPVTSMVAFPEWKSSGIATAIEKEPSELMGVNPGSAGVSPRASAASVSL